jgi:hypothetical protein
MGKAPIATRIEDLRAALQSAAKSGPSRTPTASDAVITLYPEIAALKAKRYTDAEILDLLKDKGLVMALGTFRQYYGRAARKANGTAGAPTLSKDQHKAKQKIEPKPSELARKPVPKAGVGKAVFSHRLCDDDV